MTAADLSAWVHRLEEPDRRIVVERARREPEFRRRLFSARRTAARRKLVEGAHSWGNGQILRAILEDEREYWSRVSKGLNGKLAALRHITAETGHPASLLCVSRTCTQGHKRRQEQRGFCAYLRNGRRPGFKSAAGNRSCECPPAFTLHPYATEYQARDGPLW